MGVTIRFNNKTYNNVESIRFRNADWTEDSTTEPEYIEFTELNRLASEQVNQFRLALSLKLEKISSYDLKIEGDPTPISYLRMHAFRDNTELLWVELPNSIQEIRDYAFYNCKKLKTVFHEKSEKEGYEGYKIPLVGEGQTLEELLENRVEFPFGLTRIGSYAFQNCNNLKLSDLDFGKYKNLTYIGSYAFSGIEALPLPDEEIPGTGVKLGKMPEEDDYFRPYTLARPSDFASTSGDSAWKCLYFVDDLKRVMCRLYVKYPYNATITFNSSFTSILSVTAEEGTELFWDTYSEDDLDIRVSSGRTFDRWEYYTSTSNSALPTTINTTSYPISSFPSDDIWFKLVSHKTDNTEEGKNDTIVFNDQTKLDHDCFYKSFSLFPVGSAPNLYIPRHVDHSYYVFSYGNYGDVVVRYGERGNTAIAQYSLNYSNIKRLLIEPGFSYVGNYETFYRATISKEILIPSSITSIGSSSSSYTFKYSKIDSACVHDEFGNKGWHGNIDQGYLFEGSDLTKYNMLSGTSVGGWTVFLGTPLEELYLPKTVTSIEKSFLYPLSKLKIFKISEENANYSSCNDENDKHWALTTKHKSSSLEEETLEEKTKYVYSIGTYRNLEFAQEDMDNGGKRPLHLCEYWASNPSEVSQPITTMIIPKETTVISRVNRVSENYITSLVMEGSTPPELKSYDGSSTVRIYIPKDSKKDYQSATNWSVFNLIEYEDIGAIVERAEDGTLSIKQTASQEA